MPSDSMAMPPDWLSAEAGLGKVLLWECTLRVQGLGFRGLGFRGIGFRGLGYRGLGLGFRGV